jgi:hypothetical protein
MSDNAQKSPVNEADVTIVPPDYSLKKAIGNQELGKMLDETVIKDAQKNVDKQQDNFLIWITEDMAKIDHSYTLLTPPSQDKQALAKLCEAALAIKSHAGTFGFGLASEVARSLYNFCEAYSFSQNNHLVIAKHVEVIKLILEKSIKGDGGAMGKELLQDLAKLKNKLQKS